MIIHQKFAIAHIPRTGTDATIAYFNYLKHKGLNVEFDSMFNHKKHDPFEKRNVSGKELIIIIRNLPAYMLSYINMITEIIPQPTDDQIFNLDAPAIDNKVLPGPLANIPDRYIKHIGGNIFYKKHRVIRQENLLNEIINIVKPYIDVDFNEMKKVETKKVADYDHDYKKIWSSSQIEKLYKNNPIWSSLENGVKFKFMN